MVATGVHLLDIITPVDRCLICNQLHLPPFASFRLLSPLSGLSSYNLLPNTL